MKKFVLGIAVLVMSVFMVGGKNVVMASLYEEDSWTVYNYGPGAVSTTDTVYLYFTREVYEWSVTYASYSGGGTGSVTLSSSNSTINMNGGYSKTMNAVGTKYYTIKFTATDEDPLATFKLKLYYESYGPGFNGTLAIL